MAIYGQPNPWQCGPFALKHALLAVGQFAHEDDLARLAGSCVTGGTDERELARAARLHGCRLGLVRRTDREAARRVLTRTLGCGVPALLCLDQWDHWVAAVGCEGDRFVVFDSHFEQPLRIERWPTLGDRLVYREKRWLRTRTLYDIHPLVPGRTRRARLSLTPAQAERLLAMGGGWLDRDWDEVARRLLTVGTPTGPQLELGMELAEWVTLNRNRIARAVTVSGDVNELAIHRALSEIAFVASLYNLTLRPEDEARAERSVATIAVTRAARLVPARSSSDESQSVPVRSSEAAEVAPPIVAAGVGLSRT
jgi:hypothetical protein